MRPPIQGGGRGGNTRGSAGGDIQPLHLHSTQPPQRTNPVPCRSIIERSALDSVPTADCAIIQKLGRPSQLEGANGVDKDCAVHHDGCN